MQCSEPEVLVRDLNEIAGVELRGKEGDRFYLSCSAQTSELCLKRGSPALVLSIGLEANDDDAFEEIYRRVRGEGLTIIADEPTAPGVAKAFQVVTPFGPVFEVHTSIPASVEIAGQLAGNKAPKPNKLEHANLKIEDPQACGELLERLFGLRLSDRTADDTILWFRGSNRLHHILVLFPGPAQLHHYAFNYTEFSDIAIVADLLSERDRTLVWGVGRHEIGGSFFGYYSDSFGCLVESSVGMQKIPNDDAWEPRTWKRSPNLADRWINLWGMAPPTNFLDFGIPFPTVNRY
jgi:catechol 2,3-dioxygenase-like lactoylglutathione lyase family enzyme